MGGGAGGLEAQKIARDSAAELDNLSQRFGEIVVGDAQRLRCFAALGGEESGLAKQFLQKRWTRALGSLQQGFHVHTFQLQSLAEEREQTAATSAIGQWKANRLI